MLTFPDGQITVTGSTISANSALNAGGGLFNYGGRLTVTDSALQGNTAPGDGDAVYSAADAENATNVNGSCIASNGAVAAFNEQSALQSFTGNWWGSADGPSGSGPGTGDSVSDYIDFSNWLIEPPSICAAP